MKKQRPIDCRLCGLWFRTYIKNGQRPNNCKAGPLDISPHQWTGKQRIYTTIGHIDKNYVSGWKTKVQKRRIEFARSYQKRLEEEKAALDSAQEPTKKDLRPYVVPPETGKS